MSSQPTDEIRSTEQALDDVYRRAATLQRGRLRRRSFGIVGATLVALVLLAVAVMATDPGQETELETAPVPATGLGPFQVDTFVESLPPGGVLTITGSGCPPSGPVPTGPEPIVVWLTPPSGGNSWGPTFSDDRIAIVSTLKGVLGETDVNATPTDDGTFAAQIPVPAHAPAGSGYTVRVLCTTLLELDGRPPRPGSTQRFFTQESLDAAFTTAGALTVG